MQCNPVRAALKALKAQTPPAHPEAGLSAGAQRAGPGAAPRGQSGARSGGSGREAPRTARTAGRSQLGRQCSGDGRFPSQKCLDHIKRGAWESSATACIAAIKNCT